MNLALRQCIMPLPVLLVSLLCATVSVSRGIRFYLGGLLQVCVNSCGIAIIKGTRFSSGLSFISPPPPPFNMKGLEATWLSSFTSVETVFEICEALFPRHCPISCNRYLLGGELSKFRVAACRASC